MINHYDIIMNFLIQTVATLLTPFLLVGSSIGSFFVPQTQVEEPILGASQAIPTTIAFFETTLASAISSSATTFTLTSATDKDGTTLASSTYAFVIDEGSSNEEIVIADCTATACTNASRGVSVRTGNTEVTALKKAHRRGASVKITDAPILPLLTRISRGEEGLPSASYYNSTVSTSSFSNDQQLVSKGYVDYLAFSGASVIQALETDDGVVELATALEGASSTPTGSSGASLVLQAKNATSTYNSATAGLKVVVTQNNGRIDSNFISTSTLSSGSSTVRTYLAAASPATWTKPTGLKHVVVEVQAAGGSGGSASTAGSDIGVAGGGGAGGYARKLIPADNLGTTETVTIGASGNLSSFGSHASSTSGGGGSGGTTALGGVGGTAAGGNINASGQPGANGAADNAVATSRFGGVGGTSPLGGGGQGATGSNSAGSASGNYGGGGGGGTGSSAGGAGGPAIVIVTEYF